MRNQDGESNMATPVEQEQPKETEDLDPRTYVKRTIDGVTVISPAPAPWQPIETAPRDGSRVLLSYQNAMKKWRRVIAFYAPKLSIEQDYDGDGWCDYDEANDRFFLPEGWHECIDNWDDYSSVAIVGVKPTHWMPLPPPPAEPTP
jgi:hypothetical protein